MAAFVKVGKLSDFPPGEIRACRPEAAGESVAVVNVSGRLYAFSNYCTHAGLDLSSGFLSDRGVVCMYHGSVFDAASGEAVGGPAQEALALYAVRVEGDDVLIAKE